MSPPASNMASAYFSRSTPAISASARAARSSMGVQVGLRNIRVSERMAESMSPAVVGSISAAFSRYIW